MGRLTSATLTSLLVFGSTIGEAAPKKKSAKPAVPKASSETVAKSESDSQSVRARKSVGLHLMYTPMSDFLLQLGAGATFTKSANWQFGLWYLQGNKDFLSTFQSSDSGGIKTTKAYLSGMAFAAYARYFTGNSFSLYAGLGYRAASGVFAAKTTSITPATLDAKLEVYSIIIPVGLGNHWSLKNGFTLGVDWISVMIPISAGSSSTLASSEADASLSKLNDDFAAMGFGLAKATSLTLALAQVGYVF